MRIALVYSLLLALISAPAAAAQQFRFQHGGSWLTNPTADNFVLQLENKPALTFKRAQLKLYRLSDPALLAQVVTARALKSLGEAELLRRVEQTALLWQGDIVLGKDQAAMPIPLVAAAGPLIGGIYVLTATLPTENATTEPLRIAQWFIESDFTLKAKFVGDRAFLVAVDPQKRDSVTGVQLRWCDAQGKIISQQALNDDPASPGMAILPRPEGAALLLATHDRAGAQIGGVDSVVVPNQAEIAPVAGAVIYPSAATYDSGKPFSFLIATPGDVPPDVTINTARQEVKPVIPGLWQVELTPNAMAGALVVSVNQEGHTQDTLTVPVAPRATLSVAWLARPAAILGGRATELRFKLTAGGKPVAHSDGSLTLQSAKAGDVQPVLRLPFTTDAAGQASVTIAAEALPPLAASYRLQVEAAAQQAISTPLLKTYPAPSWLEITPQFPDAAVPENVTAAFIVRGNRAEGASYPVNVKYELARESYSFEWYQADDGRWSYRTKTSLAAVLNGEAKAGSDGTAINVPVSAGRYRLTVADAQSGLSATQSFTAGWWLQQPTPATPETIELSAQVESVAVESAAKPDEQQDAKAVAPQSRIAVFIDPPYAAQVWLAALNADGQAPLQNLLVPDEGGFAYIDRTAVPSGQPLTLAAYAVPSEPAATLVEAQGLAPLPLGAKFDMKIATDPLHHTRTLKLGGLPVDQPLDRNIVQAILALYDDATNSLWQPPTRLDVGTDGLASVPLAATGKLPAKLHARVFAAHEGRLDITEQVLITPNTKVAPTRK